MTYSALRHIARTGQDWQRLIRAVQTSAPSSISPWLCVHAAFPDFGSTRSAIDQIRFDPAVVLSVARGTNTLASTRATLVSTSGARRSKANDATAPAVYAPIP